MARLTRYLLVAAFGAIALGCSDSTRSSSPTAPELGAGTTGCDPTAARGLINGVFPTSVRQRAKDLLELIRVQGAKSRAATEATRWPVR